MNLKKIEKFIDKQEVSFISSIDRENYPNVKAMLKPRKRIGLKEFYFSTNTSSKKVAQYLSNGKACVYFYERGRFKYTGVMIKGQMEVCRDQETKEMIWQFGDRMFYKQGVTDPDYCVLKFTGKTAEYYCDLKVETIDL